MDSYVKEKQLAARWGISPRTLQRWRQEGCGPSYLKLGGGVFYRLADVEDWELSRHITTMNASAPSGASQ